MTDEELKHKIELIMNDSVAGVLTLRTRISALEAERDALRGKLEIAVGALKTVAAHEGMTNLWSCCVDKTCQPVFDDDGTKLAHCLFGFGVNRGFNECAGEARQALARIEEAK